MITREQAIDCIDQRIAQRIYGQYTMNRRWPFGQFTGRDISELPTAYLVWHVCNNEDLNQYHLQYCRDLFRVCDWTFPEWVPPRDPSGVTLGHYHNSSGDEHYDGSTRRSEPVNEEYYWYKMRAALGHQTNGTTINLNDLTDQKDLTK